MRKKDKSWWFFTAVLLVFGAAIYLLSLKGDSLDAATKTGTEFFPQQVLTILLYSGN